jgi:preprotein translocase subunit SecE
MAKITQFLREVRGELTKVVWPSRRDAVRMALVVVVFSIAVAVFLGLVDFGLIKGIEFLAS